MNVRFYVCCIWCSIVMSTWVRVIINPIIATHLIKVTQVICCSALAAVKKVTLHSAQTLNPLISCHEIIFAKWILFLEFETKWILGPYLYVDSLLVSSFCPSYDFCNKILLTVWLRSLLEKSLVVRKDI